MNTNLITIAAKLSDEVLLAELKCLAQGSRQKTVELIAHLAVLASRKLYRAEGPGSLFGYCTEILRFSEAAACNRIKAAKVARKLPVILDLLTDGSVNLTTVRLLGPHLTADNHRALLEESKGMTRRQVDKLVARLAPKPDVPPSIRKLAPQRITQSAGTVTASPLVATSASTESASILTTETSTGAVTPPPATRPAVVSPLSPERYRVQVTVGQEAHDDLRYLQDLLRREIPDGDPAAIVARALRLLRQDAERKAFAATSRPRQGREPKPGSRHIPADVERKVWKRDGGQCAFIAKNGRRCLERSYIEYHHVEPYVIGGEPTVDNISLRCREHNAYESELLFGPYDPSRVRETPAEYATSMGPPTGPGTSWSVPRIVPLSRPRGQRTSNGPPPGRRSLYGVWSIRRFSRRPQNPDECFPPILEQHAVGRPPAPSQAAHRQTIGIGRQRLNGE